MLSCLLVRTSLREKRGVPLENIIIQENTCTKELMLLNFGAGKDSRVSGRRSNQSVLKEINPEYSLEGLVLKLQSFDHLIWRADSLEKTLMLGKIEGRRRRGPKRMRWLDSVTDSMDMIFSKLQRQWRIGKLGMLQSVGSQRIRVNLAIEQQQQQRS